MHQQAQTHRLSESAEADSTPRARRIGLIIVLVTISQTMLWSLPPVWAAGVERTAPNPPLLELRKAAPRTTLMALPSAGQPRAGIERQLDLNLVYSDSKLYNPGTGRYDKVRLRSYAGTDTNPERPYVAPTIEVTPGDTVRITLNNKLPPDPDCLDWPNDKVDIPHCFNGTNLHSHGLWVSPTGNSDNVLLKINPGSTSSTSTTFHPIIQPGRSGIIPISMVRRRCKCQAAWLVLSSSAVIVCLRHRSMVTSIPC